MLPTATKHFDRAGSPNFLSRGYISDILPVIVMRFFLKIVSSSASGENYTCSHPCTGDATAEKKLQKKIERNSTR